MRRNRPVFRKRPRSLLRMPLLVIATLAIIAACAPGNSNWSPGESPKRNAVKWISFEHEVRFSGGDVLTAGERKRLQAFLARHDAGHGDDVMVGAFGTRTSGGEILSAARREAAVLGEFRDPILRPHMLPDVPTAAPWTGGVKVVLGRFVVIPPKCSDWSKPSDADPNNTVSSNFGCATATNLGLMLADPGDLRGGRAPGPADGAAGARLYRSYRDGNQQQTPAITPLVIQSGVGSGTGG